MGGPTGSPISLFFFCMYKKKKVRHAEHTFFFEFKGGLLYPDELQAERSFQHDGV